MTVLSHTDIANVYPLAPAQAGMLFHRLLDKDSRAYLEQDRYRLTGPLDHDLFRAAWQQVVDRHDVLRAALVWQGLDEPLQAVRAEMPVPWQEADLAHLPPDEQQERIAEIVRRQRADDLDLAAQPPLSLTLVRLADECHELLWMSHHIMLDGWSAALVLREVFACYRELCGGPAAKLPEPTPYLRYLEWLHTRDRSAEKAFWRGELHEFDTPTPLRAPAASGGVRDEGGRRVHFALSAEVSELVRQSARQNKLALSTMLEGTWGLVLSAFSAEYDVVYGAVRSGRSLDLADVESIVGMLVNTLPVRAVVDPGAPVRDWLAALQRRLIRQRDFENSSPVDIQRWSDIPPPARLFETMVSVQAMPRLREEDLPPELRVDTVEKLLDPGYAITVVIEPGETITGDFLYRSEIVPTETAKQLAGTYTWLLEQIARDPDTPIGHLSLVSPADEERLLAAQRGPRPADGAVGRSFLDRIADQISRSPETPAVAWGDDGRLTYRELDEYADALAAQLVSRGVGPDVPVGLCFARSPELVVAMLAVLRAGGAYLAMDPEHPPQRQLDMLADTKIRLMLSAPAFAGRFGDRADTTVVPYTLASASPAAAPWSAAPAHPESVGCIIYTSGSTGTPKGVCVPHRALTWFVDTARDLGLRPGDVLGMASSPAFDQLTFDCWTALGYGATLRVIPRDVLLSPSRLRACLSAWQVAMLCLNAALLEELVLHAPDFARGVRVLLFGGQAADPWAVARVHAASAPERMIQVYGPTETTVWVANHVVAGSVDGSGDPIPLGPPLAWTSVYLLDRDLRPVPPGVPGEIYIGGDCVGRCYLGRPAATAERWIPDPFGRGRLYRTGDLAQFRADGRLEFIGRVDHQIKLRGYRVDPGEIAATLRLHPRVGAAVVTPPRSAERDGHLVAYVVPAKDAVIDADELRGFAGDRLPDYMVPADYVTLDRLPLTVTGKLDRSRLPAPARRQVEGDDGQASAPPGTPAEQTLAKIFERVLGVDRVGSTDNFFHLGGHSLLAIRVAAAIAEELHVDLTVRKIFEAPTVRQLAAVVATHDDGRPSPAETIPVSTADEPAPLASGQARLWMLDQMNPGSAEYNSPVLVRMRGRLNIQALTSAISALVARHPALRTRIETTADNTPRQIVVPPEPVAVEIQDVSSSPAAERESRAIALLTEAAARPFDLTRAPFLRCSVARLSDEDHLVLLVLHHIAYDAGAERIVAADLSELYSAFAAGEPGPPRSAGPSQVDFARWEQAERAAGRYGAELDYWRRQLHDLPRLELPIDRNRPAIRSGRGGTLRFELPAEQVAPVTELGTAAGATQFMTFLAAFAVLLAQHTGQDDLAVGTPVDLRDRAELRDVVGFFVNTVVLRLDLADDPDFTGLLGRIHDTTLDAYEQRHVPFDRVVEELNPVRDAGRTPLFDVIFQLSPDPKPEWALAGLTATRQPLPRSTSNVDLTMELTGQADGGLTGEIEYSTDLFDAVTIERMAARFVRLLDSLCATPHEPVSTLDALCDDDRRDLAELTGRRKDAAPSEDAALHRRVAGWSRRRPDTTAIIAGQTVLTYRELDERANRLARHLRDKGARRGDIVGLPANRTPETIVAILAILNTGAAYLAVEPDDPAEHVARLLRDQDCRLVVTAGDPEKVPAACRDIMVDLHADAETISALESGSFDESTGDRDLAYVIYTSGSTNRPKAVGVEHGSISHYASVAAESYRLTADDKVLQFGTFCFDAFISELWTTFTAGATLRLAGERVLTPPGLLDLAAATGTTVIDMPTAFWHLLCAWLAEQPSPIVPPDLRLIIIGGEQASAEHLKQWRSIIGDRIRLINSYGQTETAVVVTHADLTPAPGAQTADPRDPPVPIGRPLPGARLYLLDEGLRPVPPGVTGELYVAGPQVSRGYLGAPAKTADRFLPHPWGTPGERMHRTGDRARLTSSGHLVVVGRTDDQVKVRGFRVKLGEVEDVLAAFPGVRAAAVAVKTHPEAGPALVGYVAWNDADRPDAGAVQVFLRDRLPRHFVPDVVVTLPELPLTRNGKVDRRALPTPSFETAASPASTGPLTAAERAVAGIWTSVLPVSTVAAGDRFFDVGGHSLALARVATRIQSQFGLDVSLAALYERPTLAEQAAVVETLLHEEIAAMTDAEIRQALGNGANGSDE